ncbi:hypothetical protein GT037_001818 [Alternaria burnsii]|uniref:Uncharacterized protein n=1 Tax=Alternaria burnsii TaxID=1187904 RepID=A0A8H7BE49_9PLEO|nr:uncharacterized protein GT037_001818 [Alternaria burnsii]KAF7680167.1 hypothetical protein GT037_001818 [Alternaria burnsii]
MSVLGARLKRPSILQFYSTPLAQFDNRHPTRYEHQYLASRRVRRRTWPLAMPSVPCRLQQRGCVRRVCWWLQEPSDGVRPRRKKNQVPTHTTSLATAAALRTTASVFPAQSIGKKKKLEMRSQLRSSRP